ncbi:MAG: metal ABC transporter ATP-binding protein [Sodalis sp. (in: enterobacteria)]
MGRHYLVDDVTMITLHDLVTGYHGQGIGVPLDGHFNSGSMTAIVGANGSGKSTLLKTLAGLLPPVQGSLSFTPTGRPRIAYLPQQTEIDRQFPLTVFDVVAMGCWPASSLFRRISQPVQVAIWHALRRVGLEMFPQRTISTLSGGQFQRMLFAQLLVQEAPLILLDEPFNGIDKPTCNLLMTVIEQLHRQGRTIIVVLHDNQLAAQHFPQMLWLSSSKPAWDSSSHILATCPDITGSMPPLYLQSI